MIVFEKKTMNGLRRQKYAITNGTNWAEADPEQYRELQDSVKKEVIFKRRMGMKKVTTLILTVLMSIACVVNIQAATTSSYDVTVYFTGSEGLALKYAPDINAGKYFNIPEGTGLHIENVSSGWGQTTWNGSSGWVSLQYTKIVGDYPTPQPYSGYISPIYFTVYNTEGEGLELRTEPTSKSSTFGPMYDGTVIKAEARNGEWVYGQNNGHYGWCNTTYLRASSAGEISNYEAQNVQQIQTPLVNEPVSSTDDSYIQVYTDLLNANRDAINQYDWQKDGETAKPVVMNDITDDGVPELIFISAVGQPEGDHTRIAAQIHIYTAENGTAKELYTDTWGKAKYDGGYFNYYLFRMKDKTSLYYCTNIGDDGGTISYGRFDAYEDGTLKMTDLVVDRDLGSPSDNRHEYYQMGNMITEDDYQKQVEHAQEMTESILMYSTGCGDFADDFLAGNECPAMTLDEALEYLNSMAIA